MTNKEFYHPAQQNRLLSRFTRAIQQRAKAGKQKKKHRQTAPKQEQVKNGQWAQEYPSTQKFDLHSQYDVL